MTDTRNNEDIRVVIINNTPTNLIIYFYLDAFPASKRRDVQAVAGQQQAEAGSVGRRGTGQRGSAAC